MYAELGHNRALNGDRTGRCKLLAEANAGVPVCVAGLPAWYTTSTPIFFELELH